MVSFSGIDCAGKTTQIEFLERYFDSIGKKYIRIWGRGSWTPGVEVIKRIVRKDKGFSEEQKIAYRHEARTNPHKQILLLIVSILDLYFFFGIYYRFLGMFGREVICDRYIWDTCADFKVGFKRYDFESWIIWKLLLKFIPKPRISFMFVISPEDSIRRGLEKKEEYMEDFETKKAKINVYFELIARNRWSNVISGSRPVGDIAAEVETTVRGR